MRYAILLPFIASLSLPALAQDPVVEVLHTGVDPIINAIHFPTAAVGYAAWQTLGQGGVLRTTDGGATWAVRVVSQNPIRDVDFLDAHTGYVVGDDGIFRTTDDGNTWTNLSAGYFRSVLFTSADTGFAAGNYGMGEGISRTTDGGATWTSVLDVQAADYLSFRGADDGYASQVMYPYTDLYHTTDGGGSWSVSTIPGLTNGVACVNMVNADIGYLGEWERGVFKTTDGGANWTPLDMGVPFHLHALHFLDPQYGFAVGVGDYVATILRTTDGGASWNVLYSGDSSSVLTDIAFPEPGVGYVSGNRGIMLKITDPSASVGDIRTTSSLTIWPDPSNGAFSIAMPRSASEIRITDACGALVLQRTLSGEARLDLSLESDGLYIVDVVSGSMHRTQKLVVCR